MKKIRWMILLLVLALVSTVFLISGVRHDEHLALDEDLNQLVLSLFPEASVSFFNVVTELGDTIGIGIVALMMVIWLGFKKRDLIGIVILLLAVALGNEMSKWLKEVVGRERPVTAELAETLSFPSGHAMVSFILYFISATFLISHFKSVKFKWGTGIMAFMMVTLIGLSRIVLQDHYPTDVLGGYTIGLIWSLLWLVIYFVFSSNMKNRQMKKGSKSLPLNQ
ncbi:phosphatase PAP2 family protein [Niallia sp. Krafla_26]|uniref:phosphatase PAP2 family protein n=1 Tax=Niallia sp. Krafla_26 TaxID=3064703 RepID=UPI003D17DACC